MLKKRAAEIIFSAGNTEASFMRGKKIYIPSIPLK